MTPTEKHPMPTTPSSAPGERPLPLSCPFDCKAKITFVADSNGGLIKHERAPGQRVCPLNNAVVGLRTWNHRESGSLPDPEKQDANKLTSWSDLAKVLGVDGYGESTPVPVEGMRRVRRLLSRLSELESGSLHPDRLSPPAPIDHDSQIVGVTTGVQRGISIVTGTHSERDGMVTISRHEYDALQATTKAELCADLIVSASECERLREKLKARRRAPEGEAPADRDKRDAERLDWLGATFAPELARLLKRPFEEFPLLHMAGGEVFKAESLRVWIDAAISAASPSTTPPQDRTRTAFLPSAATQCYSDSGCPFEDECPTGCPADPANRKVAPPQATCTDGAARWCPIHGDCTNRDSLEEDDFATRFSDHCSDRDCPLHGKNSKHAASPTGKAP